MTEISTVQILTTPRGEARLLMLVGAAADLFLEHGYEALSIDEVIARAGGSRRNIYSHFGGKEGLFAEAVRHLCAELSAPLDRLRLDENSLPAALRAFGRTCVVIALDPRTQAVHRLMVAEGQRFPDLAQAIYAAGHHRAAVLLSEYLERYRAQSEVWNSDLPSLLLAQQFISLVIGEIQLRALVGLENFHPVSDDASIAVERALDIFMTGVFKKEATYDA